MLSSPILVTPEPNSRNQIDLSNYHIQVNSGGFNIGLEWIVANEPSIEYDEEFPYAGRNWYYDVTLIKWSNFTEDSDPWDKRDLMIGVGLENFTPTNDTDPENHPKEYSLSQNYRNPFNPITKIPMF